MARKKDINALRHHNGKDLVPVKLDMHTWVLLPRKKATKKGVKEYKQCMEESRELALRHYYGKA